MTHARINFDKIMSENICHINFYYSINRWLLLWPTAGVFSLRFHLVNIIDSRNEEWNLEYGDSDEHSSHFVKIYHKSNLNLHLYIWNGGLLRFPSSSEPSSFSNSSKPSRFSRFQGIEISSCQGFKI